MNRAQRLVLVLYCLLLAYCCLWIPWHVQRSSRFATTYVRSGYGWLWAGPKDYCPPPPSDHSAYLCEIDTPKPAYDENAIPDLELLGLRLLASTAVSGAAFFLAGLWRPATLS